MATSLQEKILNIKLTKKEKTLADYILSNYRECSFFTSTKLAEVSEVSHTSVLRFAKDLGFSGYSEFQKNIRDEYHSHLGEHNNVLAPSVKMATSMSELSQSSIIEAVLGTVQSNIQSAILMNSHHVYDAASDAIIKANMKYVVGLRGCTSITSFLTVMLKDTLPHVFSESLISGNTFDFLSDITEQDCLIVSSFARYSKLNLLVAQMAKEAGATVIVLTDTPTTPIAKLATHLLTTKAQTLTFFNSYVAALFVAEVLVTYVCKKMGMQNKEKLETINKYTSQLGLY